MPVTKTFSLQNVVDPQEVCRGLSRVFMRYRIRFQIGLVETYVNVNPTACAAGKCSNIFNLPSDSVFSSYVSVSVAAENVIGVGPARTCTTQTISELKFRMSDNSRLKYVVHISWHIQKG